MEFYKIIEKLELNYTEEMLKYFNAENIKKIKIIYYCLEQLFKKNNGEVLSNLIRQDLLDVYDSCRSREERYRNTENEINNFFDYYYASVLRKIKAKFI